MILATHGIVGAAIGRFFPRNPFLAFIAGFASHFLIDAIPHWQYPLKSLTRDKDNPEDLMEANIVIGKGFAQDLIIIILDFAAGIILSLYIFEAKGDFLNPSLILGALGGMLPDALTFFYFKIKKEPLRTLCRFHFWIQKDGENEILQKNHYLGFFSQVCFAAAIALTSKLILR